MDRPTYTINHIDDAHTITPQSDADFLYMLQRSLLLALVDAGKLTEAQYRIAEDRLHQQFVKNVNNSSVRSTTNS